MVSLSVASRSRRWRMTARAGAVVLGVLVALAAWAGLGAAMEGLRQPAFGGGSPQQLSAPAVAVASLAGGLLAWAALGVTERVFRQGRKIWLAVAGAGLVLSLSGPASGTGIGLGDRLALALLHLVVAGVVIPLLYRTAGRSQAHRPEEQH